MLIFERWAQLRRRICRTPLVDLMPHTKARPPLSSLHCPLTRDDQPSRYKTGRFGHPPQPAGQRTGEKLMRPLHNFHTSHTIPHHPTPSHAVPRHPTPSHARQVAASPSLSARRMMKNCLQLAEPCGEKKFAAAPSSTCRFLRDLHSSARCPTHPPVAGACVCLVTWISNLRMWATLDFCALCSRIRYVRYGT